MSTQALLLDFDGVICDTERAAHGSWEMLYARHGFEFPGDVWAAMLGHSQGESYAIRDLAQRLGRDPSLEELLERRRTKARLANAEPLRPGIARLLARAAQRSIRCAIVSSSGSTWVLGHLERLGVREHFAFVVTGEQADAPKPAPYLHLRALELLRTARANSVALEDSPVGVAAAKAAGLFCIAVPGAWGHRDALGAADIVLDSIEEFTFPDATGDVVSA